MTTETLRTVLAPECSPECPGQLELAFVLMSGRYTWGEAWCLPVQFLGSDDPCSGRPRVLTKGSVFLKPIVVLVAHLANA